MEQSLILKIAEMKQPKLHVSKLCSKYGIEFDYQFNFTLTKDGLYTAKTVQNNKVQLVIEKSGDQIIKFNGFCDWQLENDTLTLSASTRNSKISDINFMENNTITNPVEFYHPPKIISESRVIS